MEDEEVLLENDPLAIYLKGENITEFEHVITNNTQFNNNIQSMQKNEHKLYFEEIYIEHILKSELLFEEDSKILQAYYLNNTSSRFYNVYRIISYGGLAAVGLAITCNSKNVLRLLTTTLCIVPFVWKTYKITNKYLRRQKIVMLFSELCKFTNLLKRSLRLIGEMSNTIGYYSSASMNSSSLKNLYVYFARKLYSIILIATNLLATTSYEIMASVPLKIDNNMTYNINQEFLNKTDIKFTDLKLSYDFYLLIQSDFLKTLGLSCCQNLWTVQNCDINKVLPILINQVSDVIREKNKILNHEYLSLKNFGTESNVVRTPRKFKNHPLDYLDTCIHSSALHFQQLLCKAHDVQNVISKLDTATVKEHGTHISIMLSEMDKQLNASKNMLDSAIKHLNQFLHTDENKTSVLEPPKQVLQETTKVIDSDVESIIHGNEVYELYIPKEGLLLPEEDQERPVFSIKQLDYSGVLLEELKTILKARNPETFQEEQPKNNYSDSDDDEAASYASQTRNIYRPQQPVGLAENLLKINNVLTARRMIQDEEEIFGSSDSFEESFES